MDMLCGYFLNVTQPEFETFLHLHRNTISKCLYFTYVTFIYQKCIRALLNFLINHQLMLLYFGKTNLQAEAS